MGVWAVYGYAPHGPAAWLMLLAGTWRARVGVDHWRVTTAVPGTFADLAPRCPTGRRATHLLFSTRAYTHSCFHESHAQAESVGEGGTVVGPPLGGDSGPECITHITTNTHARARSFVP